MEKKMFIVCLFVSTLLPLTISTSGLCIFGYEQGCLLPCKCQQGHCDKTTGKCAPLDRCLVDNLQVSQSEFGDINRWGGPGCQTGNVALGKLATHENSHKSPLSSHEADQAVDGDVYTYSYTKVSPGDVAWWVVDLARLHAIHSVYIAASNLKNKYISVHNYTVWVGNTSDVFQHIFYADAPSPLDMCEYRKQCLWNKVQSNKGDMYARYVSIRKSVNDTKKNLLPLQEVAVIGTPLSNIRLGACLEVSQDEGMVYDLLNLTCSVCEPQWMLPDCMAWNNSFATTTTTSTTTSTTTIATKIEPTNGIPTHTTKFNLQEYIKQIEQFYYPSNKTVTIQAMTTKEVPENPKVIENDKLLVIFMIIILIVTVLVLLFNAVKKRLFKSKIWQRLSYKFLKNTPHNPPHHHASYISVKFTEVSHSDMNIQRTNDILEGIKSTETISLVQEKVSDDKVAQSAENLFGIIKLNNCSYNMCDLENHTFYKQLMHTSEGSDVIKAESHMVQRPLNNSDYVKICSSDNSNCSSHEGGVFDKQTINDISEEVDLLPKQTDCDCNIRGLKPSSGYVQHETVIDNDVIDRWTGYIASNYSSSF